MRFSSLVAAAAALLASGCSTRTGLRISLFSSTPLDALGVTVAIDRPARQASQSLPLQAPTGLVAQLAVALPNQDENVQVTLAATPQSGPSWQQQTAQRIRAGDEPSLTITLDPGSPAGDMATWSPDLAALDLGAPAGDMAGAPPVVATGSYTGTGTARSIPQPGFRPALVIVQGVGHPATVRTSTMSGDASFELTGNGGLAMSEITSLDASGFSVGTDATVNASGVIYYWIAFAPSPTLAVGSYTGNATNPRTINVGFMPSWVWILPAASQFPVEHFAGQAAQNSLRFGCSGEETDVGFVGVAANGFQVSNVARTNGSGTQYHYVAWQPPGSAFNVGSYNSGSGTVTTSGPSTLRAVFVKPIATTSGNCGSWKWTGMPAGVSVDVTGTSMTDGITGFAAGSFSVGGNTSVCGGGGTCYWAAYGN